MASSLVSSVSRREACAGARLAGGEGRGMGVGLAAMLLAAGAGDTSVVATTGEALACGFTVEGATHAEHTPNVHVTAMPIRKCLLLRTAALYPGFPKGVWLFRVTEERGSHKRATIVM